MVTFANSRVIKVFYMNEPASSSSSSSDLKVVQLPFGNSSVAEEASLVKEAETTRLPEGETPPAETLQSQVSKALPPKQTSPVEGFDLALKTISPLEVPASTTVLPIRSVIRPVMQEEGTMSDLSAYKDLSKAPFLGDDEATSESRYNQEPSSATATLAPPATLRPSLSASIGGTVNTTLTNKVPQLSLDNLSDSKPPIDTEISGNVQTLIRLVSELPDGVTKQNGAQIIRLTMEAMGIPMEDVLAEAQSSQTELLDAVRGNLKRIEEYKAVIRKLETDIKYYQGKANELSEIIDLFIMSSPGATGYGKEVPSY
jgi:hypothetical protein